MLEDFVNRAFDAIFLKLKERFPYLRIHELNAIVEQAACLLICQKIFKKVKKGFVVDEFRIVVLVELGEVEQDIIFDIMNQNGVIPEFFKPVFEVAPIPVAVHFEVELDVVARMPQAETPHCKI